MTDMVDVNVPRFNQALVGILTAVAFVANTPWLVAMVAAVLAISYLGGPRLALFTQIYVKLVRPRVDRSGPSKLEAAAPPRFAQLVGTLFLSGATVALLLGAGPLGWALVLVVTALALLAATTRICVGCLIYERVFTP